MIWDWEFDAAVFDMDGTLLDTMLYWRYTTLEYLLAHQLPVLDADLVRMRNTSSRRLLYEIAEREGFELPEKNLVISELEAFMDRHYLNDAVPKDRFVCAFLDALRGHGKKMCVATAATRENARHGLSHTGMLEYFDFLTDSYEVGLPKSDPEYFRAVAARLGTTADRCVVFEDALYSMEGAKQAGCRVVAIQDSTALHQAEEIRALADVYIESYAELL